MRDDGLERKVAQRPKAQGAVWSLGNGGTQGKAATEEILQRNLSCQHLQIWEHWGDVLEEGLDPMASRRWRSSEELAGGRRQPHPAGPRAPPVSLQPLLAWAGEGSSWLAFLCWKALWESVNQGLTSAEDGGGQWKDAGRLASQQCLCQCGSGAACLPEPTRGAQATSIRQLGPSSNVETRIPPTCAVILRMKEYRKEYSESPSGNGDCSGVVPIAMSTESTTGTVTAYTIPAAVVPASLLLLCYDIVSLLQLLSPWLPVTAIPAIITPCYSCLY